MDECKPLVVGLQRNGFTRREIVEAMNVVSALFRPPEAGAYTRPLFSST